MPLDPSGALRCAHRPMRSASLLIRNLQQRPLEPGASLMTRDFVRTRTAAFSPLPHNPAFHPQHPSPRPPRGRKYEAITVRAEDAPTVPRFPGVDSIVRPAQCRRSCIGSGPMAKLTHPGQKTTWQSSPLCSIEHESNFGYDRQSCQTKGERASPVRHDTLLICAVRLEPPALKMQQVRKS